MLKNIKLQDILFIDIETVPEEKAFKDLSETRQQLWEHKSKYRRNYEAEDGKEISAEEYKKLFYGNLFQNLEKKEKRAYTDADSEKFFNAYEPRLLQLVATPGIVELVKLLQKYYKLVIVSSTNRGPIKKYLRMNNIDDCFSKIYGADTHRSKVEKISMAISDNNVLPKNSIYITDTLGDILEARSAGIESIAVNWGFHEKEVLMKGSPGHIASNATELAECIKKFFSA